MPPTPAEIDNFLADAEPDAYERLVDRLLDSPRLGERLAQAWLDWARFGDTQGSNYDRPQTTWPWRDWVIRAFNANMPFDQFTIEQLAGDLLANPSLEQLVATGFNRLGIRDGCASVAERRVAILTDMVNTTGSVWLGLTMQCRPVPRPQIRSLQPEGILSALCFFRQESRTATAGSTRRVMAMRRPP